MNTETKNTLPASASQHNRNIMFSAEQSN